MEKLEEVPIHNAALFTIETAVVAATPAVLDTGEADDFQCFLAEGGTTHAYIQYDKSGRPAGYLALCALTHSECMEVRSIAVLPEHQGVGHGKAMMKTAEALATKAGRSKMSLVTSPENIKAIQFYKELGYKIISKVENYYGDGTARYVLVKQL